ncbi:SRPBCC family protein [Streptomyces sp. KL116D]|uniref:SRPBCC family protein n=1 Tax=Streptomyces sp. KL116D TaxID=3045152 RepID=UPI0035563DF3
MPCNWKTALEAFNEGYHVQTTHPSCCGTPTTRPAAAASRQALHLSRGRRTTGPWERPPGGWGSRSRRTCGRVWSPSWS